MSGMENPMLGSDHCHFTEAVTVLEPPVSMQEMVFFSGENPGVFTNGGCYLQWIASQYGMAAENTETECDKEIGDINDKDKKDCTTILGQKCDFDSQYLIETFYPLLFTDSANVDTFNDPRNLVFKKCILRSVGGHTNMVFQCPIDNKTLAICPNSCIGVDPSAIVAGGTALVAGATISTLATLPLVPAAIGISGLALMGGGAVAMMTCQGPFFCRVQNKCCLVAIAPNFGIVCPDDC